MKLIKFDEKMKEQLTKLEYILISNLSPNFLHITPPDKDGDIQIVISAKRFKDLKIHQRITEVFTLLYFKFPDILIGRLLVIQAFTERQMRQVIEEIYSEKI